MLIYLLLWSVMNILFAGTYILINSIGEPGAKAAVMLLESAFLALILKLMVDR